MRRSNDPFAGLLDRVLVISLPDGDRRSDLDQHFLELEIDYEYVDAFNGRNFDRGELVASGAVSALDEFWNAPFVDGEIGCYFSHVQAWIRAIGMGWSRVLVCEDDIEFLYVPDYLRRALQAAPGDADMLYLHSGRVPGCGHPYDLKRHYQNDFWRTASHEGAGSMAYVANTRALGYLLRNAFPMRYSLDGLTAWPSTDWCDMDLKCYICDPMLCCPRPCATTIEGRPMRRKPNG